MSGPQLSRRPTAISRLRGYILAGIVGVLIFVYVIKLFSLQIVRGFEFQDRATQVAQRVVPILARRGEIFDRNSESPIVLNIDSFAVDIIPAELPVGEATAVKTRLAAILGVTMEEIDERIPPERSHLFQPIEIVGQVPRSTVFYIAEHIEQFPGITWHNKPIRSYVEAESMSHVLGYVNDIATEELQVLYNRGYSGGDVIGKSGVEKVFDLLMRGSDGALYRTVDVAGRRVDEIDERLIPPENGRDIVLTIDGRIQELTQKALGERIGSAIVLRPATGEILAMVSYPWFDPNIFYRDGGRDEFRELSLDSRFPFLNRALQSSYAPASTFKVIMTTALLEEEAIDPNQTVDCTGSVEIGDRTFRCWLEHGHGEVNLWEALAESCNVYFGTVGMEYLGVERIADYMRRFGIGERTGIDLPSEVSGLAPSPQWKEMSRGQGWVGGDTFNISIGQGFTLVTPLQLANVVAMIANEGFVMRPRVLSEIRDSELGTTIELVDPQLLRQSTIRSETFRRVQRAMRNVVSEGTAKVVLTTKAVEVAGKTGTGEVGLEEQWNSWFVAYAPFDGEPEERVVVVVLVEAANAWEWWAPKAANIIFQGIFAEQTFEESVDALDVHWYFAG